MSNVPFKVYPLEQVLTAPYLNNEWRPDLITKLLNELIPSKCRVIVVGQNYENESNLIEPYYQTKYGTSKIDKNIIKVHMFNALNLVISNYKKCFSSLFC